MPVSTAVDISWIAILVGTIGYQVLGGLWYGPIFGTQWMAAMGYTGGEDHPENPGWTAYLMTTLSALVSVVVLGLLLDWMGATTWVDGLVVGLLLGFGLVATTSLQTVPFEDRPWPVYLLNVGYNVLALGSVGILLVVL